MGWDAFHDYAEPALAALREVKPPDTSQMPAPNDMQRRLKLDRLSKKQTVHVGYRGWGMDERPHAVHAASRTYVFRSVGRFEADGLDALICDWNFLRSLEDQAFVQDFKLNVSPISIVWLIDHHHMHEVSARLASLCDFYALAHPSRADYLTTTFANALGFAPCAINQWTAAAIDAFGSTLLMGPRSDALYGGFRSYGVFERERFVERCIADIPDNRIRQTSWDAPPEPGSYYTKSADQKFAEWTSFKTSLCVAVKQDVPIRLFDALLAGQIPLVSDDIAGLDQVISPRALKSLPILRFRANDVADLQRAHQRGVELFDAGGEEAMRRRHSYARRNHMLTARLERFAALIEANL